MAKESPGIDLQELTGSSFLAPPFRFPVIAHSYRTLPSRNDRGAVEMSIRTTPSPWVRNQAKAALPSRKQFKR